jgi:FkbM family methyltransferase
VIAIEAHPGSFAILKSFCKLNRLTNVTVLHAAAMDKSGTIGIAESQSSWMENSVEYGERASGVQVRAETLDRICEEHGVKGIAFLKMNIEGAERFALPGMASIISRIQTICVACHDFRYEAGEGEQFRTREFADKFLTDHGFSVISRRSDPRDYVRDHLFGMRVKTT